MSTYVERSGHNALKCLYAFRYVERLLVDVTLTLLPCALGRSTSSIFLIGILLLGMWHPFCGWFSVTTQGCHSLFASIVPEPISYPSGGGKVQREWVASFSDNRWQTSARIRSHQGRIRRQILPALGDLAIGEVTASHLDRLYQDLVAQGSSPASIRQTHAIIRRFFNQAMKWGSEEFCPWPGCTRPRIANRPRQNINQLWSTITSALSQ